VSSLVPIVDPDRNTLIAVLGMDTDARDWSRRVASHAVAPVLATGLIVLALAAFFLIHTRVVREQQQLAAAERKYRSIVEDITERLELEAQRRQQQKLTAIGTLARGMAHEINNPLNGLMNYAELIREKATDSPPVRGFAEEIILEGRRVGAITHSLLSFTQQQGAQEAAPTEAGELLESLLAPVRDAARERGIALITEIPVSLPTVSCRRGQILQALNPLLANALEALEDRQPGAPGTKTIHLTARRVEQWGRSWLRLTVQDNGPGMTAPVRERMFEPFFTTKNRTQHAGLGLWVSRSIVHEHGGELMVERADTGGTSLCMDLPIQEARLTSPRSPHTVPTQPRRACSSTGQSI
jgi:signal transduction histidine kinase